MEDPVEIRVRVERLLTRVGRRDDYGQLLAEGSVVTSVEDAGAWRAAIKTQARADRIKIRTGLARTQPSTDTTVVWAVLVGAASAAREAEGTSYFRVLRLVATAALSRRHEPVAVVRDGPESVFACERCDAIGYVDATTDDLFVGGALLEDDCPNETPPKLTSLGLYADASLIHGADGPASDDDIRAG